MVLVNNPRPWLNSGWDCLNRAVGWSRRNRAGVPFSYRGGLCYDPQVPSTMVAGWPSLEAPCMTRPSRLRLAVVFVAV